MTAPTGPGLRWSSLAILVISLIAWLAQTGTVHHSWNESSRLAAIESIVERGTWRIDASRYGQETGDKILWGGHYYSAKPPLFSAVGAVFYAAIYHTWGARLASEGCQPGELCVYYWLTVLLVGLPSALMAVLFYRLAARQLGAPIWAAGLTALLCFGTLVWPYSLAFNNHLIAASALLAGWYLLAHDTAGQRQVFLAGLLVSLAVMFDLTSMFVAAALFLIVVIYHRRAALFFMAAGLIPMIATLIFNYQITGTIFFPYMITTGNNFPGSVWANRDTVAALSRPDNVLLNGFYGLLGQKGLLTGTPLLIFSMAGLGRVLNNQYGRRLAVSGWLLALGFTGHLLFILSQDDILGGDNYGLRYFVPSLPLLYTFIIFVVPAWFNQPPRGHWIAGAFGLLALVSVFAAFQGTRGGAWSINPPPFYLDLQSTWPYLKPEAHLALVNPPPPRMRHGPVSYTETPAMAYPLAVQIKDDLRLLGYDLPARRVQPGQTLALTLYWQSLQVTWRDYFVFTHLLDEGQNRRGGLEQRLLEGYPVSAWHPGQIVADQRQISIDPAAPAGLTWLRVGVYELANNQAVPQSLIIDGQPSQETSLALGPILVGPPPPPDQPPQIPLSISLGQPPLIRLVGYNLTPAAHALNLVLYWESLAPTPVDWTLFVQLRHQAGEIIAQKDGPVGGGRFPSSLWQPGEVVADEILLPLQTRPSESDELVVGLYNLARGTRLAVPNHAANEIVLIHEWARLPEY